MEWRGAKRDRNNKGIETWIEKEGQKATEIEKEKPEGARDREGEQKETGTVGEAGGGGKTKGYWIICSHCVSRMGWKITK